jgi:hypothetical protein
MGYVTRVPGTAILASSHNTEYRDQVISVFASTGARDAAITVPVRGMMCFVTATGRMYVRSATAWREVAVTDSQATARQYRATAPITNTSVSNVATGATNLSLSVEVTDTDAMAAVPFTSLTLTEGVWAISGYVSWRVVTAAASTASVVNSLPYAFVTVAGTTYVANHFPSVSLAASQTVDNFSGFSVTVPAAAAATVSIGINYQVLPTITGTVTQTIGGLLQATQVG